MAFIDIYKNIYYAYYLKQNKPQNKAPTIRTKVAPNVFFFVFPYCPGFYRLLKL